MTQKTKLGCLMHTPQSLWVLSVSKKDQDIGGLQKEEQQIQAKAVKGSLSIDKSFAPAKKRTLKNYLFERERAVGGGEVEGEENLMQTLHQV